MCAALTVKKSNYVTNTCLHDFMTSLGHHAFFFSTRLEANTAMLTQQVDRLEEEMDQERKKYRMLEIKLRNSERAREDAENRNRLLQSEMEEFFSTLGNLTMRTRTNKM